MILACRDEAKGNAAAAQLNDGLGECMVLDLASFDSIRAFVEAFLQKDLPLHILVNNACPVADSFQTTADGHELIYGAGHLGPFLLTSLLLDKIKQSAPSRIINMSSTAMITGSKAVAHYPVTTASKWGALKVYCETKLANALFTMELARRLQNTDPNVIVACLHPGIIQTNLSKFQMPRIFFALTSLFQKTIPQGAATTCFTATHPSVISGGYYEDSNEAKATSLAYSKKLAKEMWSHCENVIGISFLPQADDPAPAEPSNTEP